VTDIDVAASAEDRRWLAKAIDLSRRCSPSFAAFSVGAIIVNGAGEEVSWGYSREVGKIHAEESALAKLAASGALPMPAATLYTSLEPCSARASRPMSCAQLILAAEIPRVVFAWREPALFVPDCQGAEFLLAHNVIVVELTELADSAIGANRHLPGVGHGVGH
jgi:diaminohydroxyphosphoribosylaminopyrimidine deaminase / 5-amino-6-(5-phosphoribosylamino)uracil reductase